MTAGRLSPLDVAFLCLDTADTPMHMAALARFTPSDAVRPTRLITVLAERAHRIPQLRQRLVATWFRLGEPHWAHDAGLDVDYHLRHVRLPQPGSHDQLTRRAAELNSQPMDTSRPLWELHLITGLAEGHFAVLMKFHHALTDGIGAVTIAAQLLDGLSTVNGGRQLPVRDSRPRHRPDTRPFPVIDSPARAVSSVLGLARRVRETATVAATVARQVRLPPAGSALMTKSAPGRALATVRLDMSDIKHVRRRHGGTVNDVVLAVVTGALRTWMSARGDTVDTLTIRALIPVSDRTQAKASGAGTTLAGNTLSGYLCELPVFDADPLGRLRRIRESMDRNKAVGPARGPGALPVVAGQLPTTVHRVATPWLAGLAVLLFDIVITNIPVPGIPLQLDGAALSEIYPVLPLASGHALGIAVTTYRDSVYIGLNAIRDALPDLEDLAKALSQSLDSLLEATDEAEGRV